MTDAHAEPKGLKHKLAHEMRALLWIFLYLALFFCALATYSTLLLDEFHVSYFAYGTALLNAAIMAKVILLGEMFRVGHKHESKPLIYSVIWKAFVYSILMGAFHVVEEVIKGLLHGHGLAGSLHDLTTGRMIEIVARNFVVFCALIPFFAIREMSRVIGAEKLADLFFRRGSAALTPEI
jgi:hypothetical protein